MAIPTLDRARRPATRSVLRTLPEQIADELGAAIVRGELAAGDRLLEVQLAAEYGVSRAPVREAIRLLARRGLVDFYPRKGAYVVELTTEKLLDVFNIMAVLIGLAARYFANNATEEQLEHLGGLLAELETLADQPDCDPRDFGVATWRMTNFFSRNCGSESVTNLLEHQLNETAWGTLYRQIAVDFTTPARRREAAALTRQRYEAMRNRDGESADRLSQEMTLLSREYALAALERMRERVGAGSRRKPAVPMRSLGGQEDRSRPERPR